jgi:hypothetical protein
MKFLMSSSEGRVKLLGEKMTNSIMMQSDILWAIVGDYRARVGLTKEIISPASKLPKNEGFTFTLSVIG